MHGRGLMIFSLFLVLVSVAAGGYVSYDIFAAPAIEKAATLEHEKAQAKKTSLKEEAAANDHFFAGKDKQVLGVLKAMKSASGAELAYLAEEYADMTAEFTSSTFGVQVHQYMPPQKMLDRWFETPVVSVSVDELGDKGAFTSSDIEKIKDYSAEFVHRTILISFNDINGGKSVLPVGFTCRRHYIPPIESR